MEPEPDWSLPDPDAEPRRPLFEREPLVLDPEPVSLADPLCEPDPAWAPDPELPDCPLCDPL